MSPLFVKSKTVCHVLACICPCQHYKNQAIEIAETEQQQPAYSHAPSDYTAYSHRTVIMHMQAKA